MRRLKTDPDIAPELPDKTVIDEYAGLAKEQAALYESIVRKALEETRDTSDRFARRALVLRLITGLKQVCDHPASTTRRAP